MFESINRGAPRQRLSYKKKGKQWRKDNIDTQEKHSLYHNEGVRSLITNRVKNSLLYSGIVMPEDMREALNPNQIEADYIPIKVPHHPIMTPKIDVLLGEELNRKFDYYFTVISPDAVSTREDDKKKEVFKLLSDMFFPRNNNF